MTDRKLLRRARMLGIAGLLAVVASAIFYVTSDGSRARAGASDLGTTGLLPAASAGAATQLKVRVYYFHVSVRCVTCRTIESYAREAIEQGFAKELKEGTVEWRPVNVQLPENRHFIRDYQLFTRSLVLVKMRGGKQAEWRNLDKVWDLVHNKTDFLRYVRSGVRAYLGDS